MIYLRQILGRPVFDDEGEQIGTISDLAIATGEVFPRVTSLAFTGPHKTPFMISWRKYVSGFDEDGHLHLSVPSRDIRFSYLQPDEVLLSRDLLDKQIVDTQGMKVVRVNDLKLSDSPKGMRLLGAEVGTRALIRGISRHLERAVCAVARVLGHPIKERLITWSYMELIERDMSQIKLSVTHKRLNELHPADVADILEHLDPQQRVRVFEHLDNDQAAETISEMEDEFQADVIDDLSDRKGAALLNEMDPDDAADIIGDLPYEKAEALLHLMGVDEEATLRSLLGYREETAGGIMTTEFVAFDDSLTVEQVVAHLRESSEEQGGIHYLYTTTADGVLTGVLSMRTLVVSDPKDRLSDIAYKDLITASPDIDQEECAEMISKYGLLALPVVDERGFMIGLVTIDDAIDVLEEEHEEDLHQRSISSPWVLAGIFVLIVVVGLVVFFLSR